ncbi:hypothetical protein IX51_09605 [uncultured archaeon]|nr:hypothetical protein IX51_09605 [uncultured archaeon]
MGDTLSDKIAVITGAGSGIGREMAILFHAEGAKVVIVDIDGERLKETASLLHTDDEGVRSMTLDLMKPENTKKMIDDTVKAYGRINILCNNAGIMDGVKAAAETSDELWGKVFDINVNAPFRAIREVIPHMQNQGHGVILNTGSIAGLHGGRAGAAYTASKHALLGLTKHTAAFYGPEGIRCNAMALGAVETNIGYGAEKPSEVGIQVMQKTFPAMPAPANPKEIARLALFLVSDQSSYVNGSIVVADGGWTSY